MKTLKLGLAIATVLSGLGQSAYAACPADGATPFFAAPIDPITAFPEYVEDTEGLALQVCTNGAFCFFDPPVPGSIYSQTLGFGAEGFWWLADTTITTAGNDAIDALVVMGAEAAFVNEEPDPAETFPFTRLRIRMDIATPGIYTVTHPFGQETYVLPAAGIRVVNDSFDIEFAPNQVNQGRVAPWLTWDSFPGDAALDNTSDGVADFIGITGVPHAVKGAPCGNNFFRVEAVALDGITPIEIDPADQDGDGSTSGVSETLFSLQGQIFPGNVETPLVVDSANYSRNLGGITRLNVHATAPTTATVTFDITVDGVVSADAVTLTQEAGRHFATVLLDAATPIPGSVEVIATNTTQPNNDTAVRVVPVHDSIHIAVANFQVASGTLQIVAESSDLFVHPVLTAVGLGELSELGTLTITGLSVAPATITVTSSNGGIAEAPVQVVNP